MQQRDLLWTRRVQLSREQHQLRLRHGLSSLGQHLRPDERPVQRLELLGPRHLQRYGQHHSLHLRHGLSGLGGARLRFDQ